MEHVLDSILKNKYPKNKTRKSFQKLQCHPRNYTSKKQSKLNQSCFDDKTLGLMKQIWNRRYPDNPIRARGTKQLWSAFKKHMNNSCSNEMCWIDSAVNDEVLKKKLKKKLFAPNAPKSWLKNKNEWLSSVDITGVMRQYEDTYPEFKFFGPSPIDFDSIEYKNYCVWPEICNFDIQKMIQQTKKQLGFIFNTDVHTKGGSHWIAMFIDLNKDKCFFFDSNGTKEPPEITTLMHKIKNQYEEKCNKCLTIDSNHPFVHQYTNTECGMYCLYFIVSLLKKSHNMNYFKKKRIPDSVVEKFRNVYFNS